MLVTSELILHASAYMGVVCVKMCNVCVSKRETEKQARETEKERERERERARERERDREMGTYP